MSREGYNIVIVCGGAAGCVVASYLAEHADASIALIQADDMDRDPFIHIPAGFAKMLVHERHVWKYEKVPQHGPKRAYRSAKVLGGNSSLEAMCYVRGQIRDYAAWQDSVGDIGKWSYEDLLRVFTAQEDNDTFHDEYHGIDGGLAVQLPKGINKLNQYCLGPSEPSTSLIWAMRPGSPCLNFILSDETNRHCRVRSHHACATSAPSRAMTLSPSTEATPTSS